MIVQSAARHMPLLYDDPHRYLERDANHELASVLERLARGLVWVEHATEQRKPRRPVGRSRINPPRPRRPAPMPQPAWLPPQPEWPRYVRPPHITPWVDGGMLSGAIAGYHDFESQWRSFGALYLLTDRAIASPEGHGYFCTLDARRRALEDLCTLNRWPSLPAASIAQYGLEAAW